VSTQAQRIWSGKSGLYFVLLFGAVNLFADMTYEGARSVTGPFLGLLGASGFIVVAVYAPLAFFGGFTLSLIGSLLWGIGLGAHESVMQAAVAQTVSQERLGSAYGVFGAAFGVAWFAGSAALGALYDISIGATVALAVVAQLLAIVPIAVAARKMRNR
jgi:predicted MFS family arabinose efflux permease